MPPASLRLGLPVSPLCDRTDFRLGKSQAHSPMSQRSLYPDIKWDHNTAVWVLVVILSAHLNSQKFAYHLPKCFPKQKVVWPTIPFQLLPVCQLPKSFVFHLYVLRKILKTKSDSTELVNSWSLWADWLTHPRRVSSNLFVRISVEWQKSTVVIGWFWWLFTWCWPEGWIVSLMILGSM